MKNAIVKAHIILEINGVNMSFTKHMAINEIFVLDTEKYPNAKLVAINFVELQLIF